MHKASLLPIIIIASVAIGGLLYLYGGPAFHQTLSDPATADSVMGGSNFKVLAHGENAPGIDQRVNYRVKNDDQLTELWQMIYSNNGQPVPNIDFNRYEVLALFDGSHSTGGYGIQVTDVSDSRDSRGITIVHTTPGPNCATPGTSSPFIIIQVQKSTLPINHIDQDRASQCQ